MSLPSKPFQGAGFFSAIRTEMAANRGMFAGTDGALCYACMDASFYRLKIFKKNGNVSFTSAAASAPAAVRVIANGQWFDTNYCDAPCSNIPWHGQIIVDGVKEEPKPLHKFGDDKRYFGQFIGRSAKAFRIGAGYPSAQTEVIYDGLFPLAAVVVAKRKASLGGLAAQSYATGKILYGIHRASDIVFVVAEEDWYSSRPNTSLLNGVDIPTLADRLVTMGVDDAVLGDGGTSATLLVDRNLEVKPREAKDFTMRVGPMFILQTLKTQLAASKLTVVPTSTDAKFPSGTVLAGVSASFSQTNSGMQMQALSLGVTGSRTAAQLMQEDLELPLVLILTCPGSRLTGTTTSSFATFTGPKITAALRLEPAINDGGRIVGKITVDTSRGKAVFAADWSLVP